MPESNPSAEVRGRRRLKLLLAAASLAILAASTMTAVRFQPVLASSSFLPVADSDVSSSSPTKNYGRATTLRVRLASSGATYRSFLQFSVSGLAGAVTRIQLRLYVTDPTTTGGTVFRTGTSWTETGVTWKTQPATVGGALASFPATSTATWTSIDLPTSLIAGNGVYGLAILGTTSNQAGYSSRQGTNPPQLVVDSVVSTPTPTTTPSPTRSPTATPSPTPTLSPTPTPSPTASPSDTPTPSPIQTPSPPADGDPVVLAAGDIACSPTNGSFNGGAGSASACHQVSTSDLILAQQPAAVLALGDLQYDAGALSDFLVSYDPSWGRVKAITHPAVGNHEYQTAGAAGYYTYFGTAAGSSMQGWYSFDVGTWHILAINSNCAQVAGCGAGSPQETWVRTDLAAHSSQCTLAYWHHPRYSSGLHGSDLEMQPIWQDLVDAGAALVLSGHDHGYERFAPQDSFGTVDPYQGVRQFVVGTGGASHYDTWTLQPNSQVHDGTTFGVFKLTLRANTYDWQFVPDSASGFTDAGSANCHAPSTPDVSPPSVPVGVNAAAVGPQSVQLDWSPSVDDTTVALYQILRDGQVVGSAASTSYLDATAPSGVVVSYAVRARDAAGNWSAPSDAASVTTPTSTTYLFSDDFERGGLAAWTLVSNLVPATGDAHSGIWAARSSAASTSAPASYADRDLPSAQSDLFCRVFLKVESQGTSALDLLKLRTASGTSIAYLLRSSSGMIAVRNNVSGVTTTSQTPVSLSVWHELELHVRMNGSAGSSDAWLDGAPVPGLSQVRNFGSSTLGRVEMGENAASRVYSVLFDDIACSVSYVP